MRRLYSILMILATLSAFVSCEVVGDDLNNIEIGVGEAVNTSTTISPSCMVENRGVSRAAKQGYAVRSLIDQITTKKMNANFLRLDEDISASNDGLYTFTGNTDKPVNWNKAILLESTIISSPDNTEGIHYRSVSLVPDQSYKLNIGERKENGETIKDTTHFYHTRMVGWYPMNCFLPRTEGVPATAQFEYSAFDAVRLNETVEIDGVPTDVVAVKFTGLDGETDLMVSDVCEAQSWHKYNSSSPHRSDVHPEDNSNIYREPFGHHFEAPTYSNYFRYRHYRSAVRIIAHADRSSQNLNMWGDIQNVVLRNQPTSCKVWLPTELGQFGQVYEWGDYADHDIVCTPMFDNDINHPEYNQTVTYPIDIEGFQTKNDIYLGYSLVQPHHNVDLEIYTTSGIYSVIIEAEHKVVDDKGNENIINIFDEGYIYNIRLNLKTDGTIAAILEKEGDERYYDLSSLQEFEVDDGTNATIRTYKLANCYILDPNKYKDGNGENIYDGYCFLATTVGNGKSGIVSSGAQTLYPTNETIEPKAAYLLWESQLGLISDIELKFGYVRFKLPDPEAKGNAVIAVYDENDKVLWSWHIWITDTPAEQKFSTGDHDIIFLDRNIGATAATCNSASNALATYGLYYQWGRKDPSMGPPTYNYSPINLITAPYYDSYSDEKTAAEVVQFAQPTLQNSVENPMYLVMPTTQPLSYIFNWTYQRYDFLWGYNEATGKTSKTIYDPCPFGYRVPSSELNSLFSTGSGSAGTYGYTRTVSGTQFFFPYTGFKGVDMGLNSLICSWKYVGQKGDYQSSMYCMNADAAKGDISQYMHRERVYISSANSWTETGVGSYSGNMIRDYANRRTAAPVRCVNDDAIIGSISASLTPSIRVLQPDTNISFSYQASSYGCAIESITITAKYTTPAGLHIATTVGEELNIHKYQVEGVYTYRTPSDYNSNGIVFQLVVHNEHGLVYTEEILMVETSVSAEFNRWVDTYNESVTNSTRDRGFVVIGEEVRYYINVSSSANPTSVTIDGKTATASGTFTGDAAFNTTYYITWSKDSMGVYPMTATIVAGGETYEIDLGDEGKMTVYGLTRGNSTTSLDTSGNTLYVIQNISTDYDDTYLTSVNENLAANKSMNYYNLFTIHNGTGSSSASSTSITIKSVARGTYFNGKKSDISFSRDATSYSYNSIQYRITYSNYKLRQTSESQVALTNASSGALSWNIYTVTYDIP